LEVIAMKGATITLEAAGHTSTHNFIRHFVEMLVAMIAGMAILGAALSLGFALVGHSNPVHFAGLRALVMTTNMTTVGEMAGAMFLPFVALIGPYEAGLLSGGAFLVVMHVLMLPCMLVVMFRRWDEYAQDHQRHASNQPRGIPAATRAG
jgi:hypothetical protein